MFLGLLIGSPDRLSRRTQGRTPFHPKQTLCGVTIQRAHPLPATPFSVHDHGRQRSYLGTAAPFLPQRWPDCTSSHPHPGSDRRWSPAGSLSVSPHSGADGLVQGELPPISPEFLTVFTSLACYLGALPGLVRTVVPVPRGDHLPFLGSPVLPPSRLTGGIATPTRRYHGRMLMHPSLPECATPNEKVFAHTQVRDPRECAVACS